jgi:hypothetical protein
MPPLLLLTLLTLLLLLGGCCCCDGSSCRDADAVGSALWLLLLLPLLLSCLCCCHAAALLRFADERMQADPSSTFAATALAAAGVRLLPDLVAAPVPTSLITTARNTGSRTIVACKQPGYRNASESAVVEALRTGRLLLPHSSGEMGLSWIHFEGRDGPDLGRYVKACADWRAEHSGGDQGESSDARKPLQQPQPPQVDGVDTAAASAAAFAPRTTPGGPALLRRPVLSLELEKPGSGRAASLMAVAPLVDVVFVSSTFARHLGHADAPSCVAALCCGVGGRAAEGEVAALAPGTVVVCAFGAAGAAAAVVPEPSPGEGEGGGGGGGGRGGGGVAGGGGGGGASASSSLAGGEDPGVLCAVVAAPLV